MKRPFALSVLVLGMMTALAPASTLTAMVRFLGPSCNAGSAVQYNILSCTLDNACNVYMTRGGAYNENTRSIRCSCGSSVTEYFGTETCSGVPSPYGGCWSTYNDGMMDSQCVTFDKSSLFTLGEWQDDKCTSWLGAPRIILTNTTGFTCSGGFDTTAEISVEFSIPSGTTNLATVRFYNNYDCSDSVPRGVVNVTFGACGKFENRYFTLVPGAALGSNSIQPTSSPSIQPSWSPTASPRTSQPSKSPSFSPTSAPSSSAPSASPSKSKPSASPSRSKPSISPSGKPSASPTPRPTVKPTLVPTAGPSSFSLGGAIGGIVAGLAMMSLIGWCEWERRRGLREDLVLQDSKRVEFQSVVPPQSVSNDIKV